MRGSECRTDTLRQLCTGLRVLAELWTVIQVLWEICGRKGLKHTADFTKICVAWFIFLFNSQSAGCAGPQVPQICADEIRRQGTSSSHPLQFLCVPPRGCDRAAFWNIFFFWKKFWKEFFERDWVPRSSAGCISKSWYQSDIIYLSPTEPKYDQCVVTEQLPSRMVL